MGYVDQALVGEVVEKVDSCVYCALEEVHVGFGSSQLVWVSLLDFHILNPTLKCWFHVK